MKLFFMLFLVCLTITSKLSAQNPMQEFTDRMNHIFQYVDRSRVPTGLLSDFGLQMVELRYFDGIPSDSNFVSMPTWRMLYAGIYTSQFNNNIRLTNPETVFDRIDNATHPTAVPVAMMHFQYNALNEDAEILGLMQIINYQLHDVPGAASPYITRQVFAAAPRELYFSTNNVSFVFDPNLWHSNVNRTILRREINFNNETGFVSANWNVPVSHRFNTGGIKTIYFRLTYTDGSSYTSRTNIFVELPGLRAAECHVRIQPDTSFVIAYRPGVHSGGTVQIRFSRNNYATRQITRPLIVAEGLEANNLLPSLIENTDIGRFICDKLKSVESPINANRTLYDDIAEVYDIIYLDYNDGVDCIWRNALLFKEVIDWVNQNRLGDEPNVVMGLSMGGLVAPIALRQMELAGRDHQTRKLITVDAPHKGANMPVGFQAMLRHLQDVNFRILFWSVFRGTDLDAIQGAIDLMDSPATRQLLIYSLVDINGTFDNRIHQEFQAKYHALGFPQGFPGRPIENVAISNGTSNGGLVMLPGSNIFGLQGSIPMLPILQFIAIPFLITNYPQVAWNTIPGSSQFRTNFSINALQDRTASRVYRGRVYIRHRMLWVIPVNIDLENETVYSRADMLPLDGAPGGKFDFDVMGGGLISYLIPSFSFVPTGSSLALDNWRNLRQTVRPSTPRAPHLHQIFVPNRNEPHVYFGTANLFLYNLLRLYCVTDFINQDITTNRKVVGCQDLIVRDVTVSNGSTLTLRARGNICLQNITVTNNSRLILYAEDGFSLGVGFNVELGSTFETR